MKKEILLILLLFCFTSMSAQYVVRGGSGTPLLAIGEKPMKVYLLYGLEGGEISYTSSTQGTHQWYRYKEKASDAEPIPSQQTGNTSVIIGIEDGYGYFVGSTVSPATEYVWIIDYSKYLPVFNSFRTEEDIDKCKALKLVADMDVQRLWYYTATGSRLEVRRAYMLKYSNLKWDDKSQSFTPFEVNELYAGSVSDIPVDSILQDTEFELVGDVFAIHFNHPQSMKTPEYKAISVSAHGILDPPKNKIGTSAPVTVTFTAVANEPVAAFYIWKISKLNQAGVWESIVRYTDKELRYTFDTNGTYQVKLEVSDRQSICLATDSFSIIIDPTDIKVPNAFSPGSSIGVNDEFKVSTKSVLKFKCTIFNRWGNKLFEWDDPAKGWDGRVNGILVPTGAYFYIIQYTGTDHKSKSKSGTINVLRGKD